MRGRLLLMAALSVAICNASQMAAQDIDSNITSRDRSAGVIADQIRNLDERAAFVALYDKVDAQTMQARAEAFLARYPDSAFLAQAYEIAARSCFDTGNYGRGLEYARQSLLLLPENPLLLVATAYVQAGEQQNDEAVLNAADALRYLDEFARPISVPESTWPEVKRQQQAMALLSMGRAQLQMALKESAAGKRQALLESSLSALSQARSLNPDDQEVGYLLGIAHLSAGQFKEAASELADIYGKSGSYSQRALASLQELYRAQRPTPAASFQDFLNHAVLTRNSASQQQSSPVTQAPTRLPEYAGSFACKGCHAKIYRDWSESGMARMLRPYQPPNVIGDFAKNNEFYTGDDVQYVHGKLNILPGSERRLFARMTVRGGKHYFDIRESDGQWHTYPVNYTIGSKWQQAYATRLPNGQIHVFPIQYSVIEKRWLNYWRSLDGPGSARSDPHNFERLDNSTSYQAKCAVCHTSQLRNTKGGGLDADGVEFREPGVGCEMCHGPSADHVAAMNAADFSDKDPLDPPVDFHQIGNTDFVAICAQCHRQATLRDPGPHGELNYSTSGKFFQANPSVPFGEFTRKGFYKDGRFSQTTFIVEALERSKCFRLGKVSCGDCHDPHGHDFSTNRTSLRFKEQPDRMCTGCHKQYQGRVEVAAHTHHPSGSEGSRCIACHMPKIMDALTFSARTHQIDDIPNAEMTLRFGQQESPNACLLCHKDKTAQWVQNQLRSWNAPRKALSTVAAGTGPRGIH